MEKYYSAISLIIRDENDYLEEWLSHHISIGFEHFYIYDNNSEIPIKDTISSLPLEIKTKVTVIDWCGAHKHAQHEQEQHAIKYCRDDCHWLAFIDTDEFIVLHKHKNIKDFLMDYDEFGGIYIPWVMYNANGKVKREDKPVMERFTRTCENLQVLGKMIVQPKKVEEQHMHQAFYKDENDFSVDEKKNRVSGKRNKCTTDIIQCNHYYTKSFEEWIAKIARGVADPWCSRQLSEFFDYNPDLKYLDTGQDFAQIYEKGFH